MRLLMDTQTLIWWAVDDLRLGAAARAAILDPANKVWVSSATTWEIATKYRTGQMPACGPLLDGYEAWLREQDFEELMVTSRHALRAGGLNWTDPDPFHRMLLAQAWLEGLVIASNNPIFDGMGVQRIWD